MNKTTRHLIVGASVLAMSISAYAQSSTTAKKKDLKETAPSQFSGSFMIGLGQDSNIGDTKDGTSGSFYEMKPSLSYKSGIFSFGLNAGIKDFSDQQISVNAKETSGDLSLGIDTQIFGGTDSSTQFKLSYGDSRLPDYFDPNAGNSVSTGVGMPNRYVGTEIAQSLGWDLGRLNIKTDASFLRKDYSSTYSDFNGDLLGRQDNQLDHDKITGKARVGIKLRDSKDVSVELAATPLISVQQYDDRQARESNGRRIGFQGVGLPTGKTTEFLVNEMKAELNITAGVFTITPNVTSGLNIDQANGGEDYRYNEAGLSTSVTLNKKNNVKINASMAIKNEDFDNWTVGVVGADRREDDIEKSSIGASFNVSKSVSVALDYSNYLESSTLDSQDVNYRQEVVSTGLTVNF